MGRILKSRQTVIVDKAPLIYFFSDRLFLYPLNVLVAEAAARLSVDYNLKTPDSIQLDTAKVCGADMVLTNDRDWRTVKELRIVTLVEIGDSEGG